MIFQSKKHLLGMKKVNKHKISDNHLPKERLLLYHFNLFSKESH